MEELEEDGRLSVNDATKKQAVPTTTKKADAPETELAQLTEKLRCMNCSIRCVFSVSLDSVSDF